MPAASPEHAAGFENLDSAFSWPQVFLKKLSLFFGNRLMTDRLRAWDWAVNTSFSGVGAPESAKNLMKFNPLKSSFVDSTMTQLLVLLFLLPKHLPYDCWSRHISAEALTSLQAEARKFLSVAGDHVECDPKFHLEFGIEIDKSCQKVLADTYGTCVFPNVLDFNPDQKRHYCTTHKKKCHVIKKLKKKNKSKRSSTKQCMFFVN